MGQCISPNDNVKQLMAQSRSRLTRDSQAEPSSQSQSQSMSQSQSQILPSLLPGLLEPMPALSHSRIKREPEPSQDVIEEAASEL
jgi:hypothetical protein